MSVSASKGMHVLSTVRVGWQGESQHEQESDDYSYLMWMEAESEPITGCDGIGLPFYPQADDGKAVGSPAARTDGRLSLVAKGVEHGEVRDGMLCGNPWHLCCGGGRTQAGLWLAIDLPP